MNKKEIGLSKKELVVLKKYGYVILHNDNTKLRINEKVSIEDSDIEVEVMCRQKFPYGPDAYILKNITHKRQWRSKKRGKVVSIRKKRPKNQDDNRVQISLSVGV